MLIGKELCLSRPAKDSNRSTNGDETVTKRVFLRHLYIKMIILPRQARDKHSRETQKRTRFCRILVKQTIINAWTSSFSAVQVHSLSGFSFTTPNSEPKCELYQDRLRTAIGN